VDIKTHVRPGTLITPVPTGAAAPTLEILHNS